MVKIDLHLHSSRYSNCSQLSVEHLALIAPALPLQGVVITEHNKMWSKEELEELQQQVGSRFRFYRGVEIGTPQGHILAYNLKDTRKIYNNMPLKELSEMALEDKAALVLAHPGRFSQPIPHPPEDYWQALSAIEVMSNSIREELVPEIIQAVNTLKRPLVAGSDSHAAWTPGLYATIFPHMPVDEAELADMIIKGVGIPWANEKHIKDIRRQIPENTLLCKNPLED
ncbi:MAG: hypothetical protein PF447_02095 [Spirochaetaceae bacterium]|jgi:histidinol phosphatase-like PHP family hydrolase|nr:hypothetical protein [Spirochaetaceae bacterium]